MPRKTAFGLLVAALLSITFALPVMARDGDVVRTGACSGSSDWKIKAGPRDGGIEVEFEVDQNVNGVQWRVKLVDNGDVFFRGNRTTQAPSGSFEVERKTANRAGTDQIVGRAVNLSSGEVCRGVISL
jgi:hypothetical protein